MTKRSSSIRKLAFAMLVFIFVYLGIGLGFHFKWSSELAICNEARRAQGESVEPEMFRTGLGLAFDVVYWPIYCVANIYHNGTGFATPCTH